MSNGGFALADTAVAVGAGLNIGMLLDHGTGWLPAVVLSCFAVAVSLYRRVVLDRKLAQIRLEHAREQGIREALSL